MTATKRIRIDRTYSSDNVTDATARNLISFTEGSAGFNATTGVISIPTNTSQLINGAGFLTSSDISGKQNTLVSGTNIKTINGSSILGSGDLTISGGGSNYTLPTASNSTLGGVKVDNTTISITNGVISAWSLYSPGAGCQISVPLFNQDNNWTFDAMGKLTIPAGGDILDGGTGLSVLGGGGGASLGNLAISGSTITASSLITYTSSDWIDVIWWSNNVIYIIGAHPGLAGVASRLVAYSSRITINNVDYTVQSSTWNDNSGFIYTTTLIPNVPITSIKLVDDAVHINILAVETLTGGSYGGKVKLFEDKVAIGLNSGNVNQGGNAVAIGYGAGNQNQGQNSIAIGTNAGSTSQGNNSIVIGYNAGQSSAPANSIILQGNPDAPVSASAAGFYVSPVRSDATPINIIYYNASTKEMTYGGIPASSGGGGGGSTGGMDATQFGISSQPGNYVNNASSFTWDPPTHIGNTLVILIGPAWINIMTAGPSMTQLSPTYGNISPPWASIWYGSAIGSQTAQLQYQGSGYPSWVSWTLDSSTTPGSQSSFVGNIPCQLDIYTYQVTLMNATNSLMGWQPTSPGYMYAVLYTDAQGITDFTPGSASITYLVDGTMGRIFMKIPASVWTASSSVNIGSLVGPTPGGTPGYPTPNAMMQVVIFGV